MGIFSSSSDCPAKPNNVGKAAPIAGSLTFQHLLIIINWACFGVSALLWLSLIIPHLRRYRIPNQQRQIFRVVSTPLVYSITAVISTHLYSAAGYLAPLANLYEAYALASLFLLFVHYVAPDSSNRAAFFQSLELKTKKGAIVTGGSLRWFWNTWRLVFFYTVIYTILIVVQEITRATGTYCSTSSKPRFAHVWLQALELITTVWALLVVVRFQRRLRGYMVGKKALSKLVVFKLFVITTTLQHFIFGIVESHVKGNTKVTYNDITIGLPALLISAESVVFMVAFHFVFNADEYRHEEGVASRYSAGQALLHALNPIDLVQGITQAFGSLGRRNSL